MKKITFLAVYFLVGSMVMYANGLRGGWNSSEPLMFEERGVAFYVFLNGDFDFNTRPHEIGTSSYVYRRGASAGGARPVNVGVRVDYDNMGRVRRVGNTFINYDRLNRVARIGNVAMFYNRNGLERIGGMTIVYDRRGNVMRTHGTILRRRGNGNHWANNHSSGFSTGNYYYGPAEPHNNSVSYVYRTDGSRAPIEE